jgi:hypothetical protein
MDYPTFFGDQYEYNHEYVTEDYGTVIQIDFASSFKSGHLQLNNIDESEKTKAIKTYLSKTYQIWYDIKINLRGDQYLDVYSNLPISYFSEKKLNSTTSAETKLFGFKDGYYGHLISLLKDANLDCLIAGSAGLAATFGNIEWVPNDIDLYVKNINYDTILKINNVIKKSVSFYSPCTNHIIEENGSFYSPCTNHIIEENGSFYSPCTTHVIIVRKSLTINWVIFGHGQTVLVTIQLNLLNIRSWADLFICYHTDHVCIGYEIKSNGFIYLRERWIRYLTNKFSQYPRSVYYCNLFNLDTPHTLYKACLKYGYKRGIRGQCLFTNVFKFKINLNINNDHSLSSDSTTSNKLFEYLHSFCGDENYAISSDIRELIVYDEKTPDMIDLKDLMCENAEFSQRPKILQSQININFGRLIDNDSYLIKCKSDETISPYTQSRFHLFWVIAIYANEYYNKWISLYPLLSPYKKSKFEVELIMRNYYRNIKSTDLSVNLPYNEFKNRYVDTIYGELIDRYITTMHSKLVQRRHLITQILHKHPILYKDVIDHILSFIWPKIK